ncbi:MAG: imidazole glycerol phosphate synthase subunit HisF [Nitrososphaerota archaeon]|nr:imidazole glycerol phosphate synthase subunit HisF [Nitrososphaerota archaeon]
MLTKRIIPCLDVKDGKVVKGTHFVSLRSAGDPVELAKKYCRAGADEVVFLDISASNEKRKTKVDLARRIAQGMDIPFTIGGGISSIEDARIVLTNGADKVSVNTSAVRNPKLISDLADLFGTQCVVVAIDAKRSDKTDSGFTVCTSGGGYDAGIDAIAWSKKVESLGAGEILLTSIDRDGTKNGYDTELTRRICSEVSLPVIASGGCGKMEDFLEILKGNNAADAALAASVFHYGQYTVKQVKKYLYANGINVRI